MPSISSGYGPITEAMQESCLWNGTPVNSPAAVYLSAGNDSRMLTATHPDHIRERAGNLPVPEPFAFYVHVDKAHPRNRPDLTFDDGRTRITEWDKERTRIGGYPAWFLKLTVHSDLYPERNVSVLRIRATNDEFTELALAEDWKTHCLITVCDGCAFGGNSHCENDISGARETNLMKLKPDWLLTDHFSEGGYRKDWIPQPGELIAPEHPTRFPFQFTHTGFLAGPKYYPDGEQNRYPERFARLYRVEPNPRWEGKGAGDV